MHHRAADRPAGSGTVVVVEAPPNDPDDWSAEEWQDYLQATAADAEAGAEADEATAAEEGAGRFRRMKASAGGAVMGAALLGIEQALYGERPSAEVVAEAESDDPDRDLSLFDPDDPRSATLSLVVDPPSPDDAAD